MRHLLLIGFALLFFSLAVYGQKKYNLADYGIKPDTKQDMSVLLNNAISTIQKSRRNSGQIEMVLPAGRYDFFPKDALVKEYYISNHDQRNPKYVGIAFENMKNVIFNAQGAEFVFHGRMLPVSLINTENCTLKNFSIDFENPHISQAEILDNDTVNGTITFKVAPWVNYSIKDSVFSAEGQGWKHSPGWGVAFDKETKRLLYKTGDIGLGVKNVAEIAPGIIKSYKWKNKQLVPGAIVVMRSYNRPTPGVFVSGAFNTTLAHINVHYAEGMGLLAQMSENITLDKFSVCLKGANDPRYFTTQADATHFSGCKGKIISRNGLYEGMMDDAINVHGTYLRITKKMDERTLVAKYMHQQSYGFNWGFPKDVVQFIQSNTMELVGRQNKIKSISPVDKASVNGAKEFRIVFESALDPVISDNGLFGIENMEWTPEVIFSDNLVRNNRARGALFSTPKPTVVENNFFDHTSGTAIVLCGDCNGWYETGACNNVIIRNNRFLNSLTSLYQFTNAVISIYPEIPELNKQTQYFHSNIIIENNLFEVFDEPVLYAKSVDGLIFKNNKIKKNNDFKPFHWNKKPFLLERVINEQIKDNIFD